MTTRTEAVRITNGNGALEVRGSDIACGLWVYGKPFVLNWIDGAGSIGQDLLRNADAKDDALAQFRTVTTGGVDPNQSLEQQFTPLLQQFKTGTYTLVLEELQGDVGDTAWYPEQGELSNYYPYDINLTWTQPAESINEERVQTYKRQIEAGGKPVIVTTSVEKGMCEFILDGHHKRCAYGQLGLPTPRLCIVAHETPRLTIADYPGRGLPRSYFDALTWEGRYR